jgi:histone deacetylase 1/2
MFSSMHSKKRICYFQNKEIGKYWYSKSHPMKPKRIAMTHSLINSCALYRELDVYLTR